MRGDFEKRKRMCLFCGMKFKPQRADQKYCCRECYKRAVQNKDTMGCAESTSPSCVNAERKSLAASERWKRMSWKEITVECARLHLTYGQAQQMYYNNTLPEDFGLGGE